MSIAFGLLRRCSMGRRHILNWSVARGWSGHLDLEWKPRDLWIGAYYETDQSLLRDDETGEEYGAVTHIRVWLCLLPCLPLKLSLWNENDVPF